MCVQLVMSAGPRSRTWAAQLFAWPSPGENGRDTNQASPGYFAAALSTSSSICCSSLAHGSKELGWLLGLNIILTPLGAVLSALLPIPISTLPFIAVHSPAASPSWVFSACSCFPVCPLPFQLRCQRWPLPLCHTQPSHHPALAAPTLSTPPGSRLLEHRACPSPFIS